MDKEKVLGKVQQFGQSLLVPVAVLPATGILYGIGNAMATNQYLIAVAPWLQNDFWHKIATLMSGTGSIIFSNLALVFAVGVAIGLAKKNNGTAALAAVVGYLIMNMSINAILGIDADMVAQNATRYQSILGIYSLRTGVFGGIIIGLLAAWAYNKFHDLTLPQYLGFFQGKRSVPIIVAGISIVVGGAMCVIWPPIQGMLDKLSYVVMEGNTGFIVFIYGIIVKLLNPVGLHSVFYTPFYYEIGSYINAAGELITGDKAIFFAQIADGAEVTGGIFSNAAFCMDMFACWGGAYAIYRTVAPEKKKLAAGILVSACITSTLTGITEPWIFAFLFTAPLCFVAYALLNGVCYLVCYVSGIRLVSTFASGFIDYVLVGMLNNAPKWYLIIPVGIIFGILEYFLFALIIKKFHYKDIVTVTASESDEKITVNKDKYEQAKGIIAALGGKENIEVITCCATRLRITVKDDSLSDKTAFSSLGAKGLAADKGKSFQIIMGLNVSAILDTINQILENDDIETK